MSRAGTQGQDYLYSQGHLPDPLGRDREADGDVQRRVKAALDRRQDQGITSARLGREHRDHLGHLAEAGVDSFVLRPPGDSLDHTVEALHQYAETFLKG